IICANNTPGADTITVPAGTYTLTITGAGEDAAATGDLDITEDLTLNGAGAATTIIQAGTTSTNGIDRVFDTIGGNTVTFSGLTIRNGLVAESGGGIRAKSSNGTSVPATIQLIDSIVSNNTAMGAEGGGGINDGGSS